MALSGLLALQTLLWVAEATILFSMEHELPFIYPQTECSDEKALQHYQRKSLWECQKLCASVQLCGLINYNPITKLCTLQEHGVNQSTGDGICISLKVDFNDSTGLLGTCALNTCDNTSLCVPLKDTINYKCIPRFCPNPPSIAHATLLMNTMSAINDKNAYVCVDGYTGVGNSGIQCIGNRTWTSTNFTCYPNCPLVPLKASADIISWSPLRLFANTTAQYACKPGYYNLTHSSIICDDTGTWSQFECLPYCYQSRLPTLTNGAAVPGDKYTVNMAAEFTCNQDYYLSPWSPLLYCDATGTWSALQVECFKHCSDPANPADGHMTAVPINPFVDGSTATFECEPNHYSYPSDANRQAVCGLDGEWDYLAVCYKQCDNLPGTPLGSNVQSVSTGYPYTVDTFVTYECWVTNYLSAGGNDRKSCNKFGSWNGLVVCCVHGLQYSYSEQKCKLTFG